MQRQRLAARQVGLAARRAAAVDSDTEGPDTNPSGSAADKGPSDEVATLRATSSDGPLSAADPEGLVPGPSVSEPTAAARRAASLTCLAASL